jgi:hypothetical protein
MHWHSFSVFRQGNATRSRGSPVLPMPPALLEVPLQLPLFPLRRKPATTNEEALQLHGSYNMPTMLLTHMRMVIIQTSSDIFRLLPPLQLLPQELQVLLQVLPPPRPWAEEVPNHKGGELSLPLAWNLQQALNHDPDVVGDLQVAASTTVTLTRTTSASPSTAASPSMGGRGPQPQRRRAQSCTCLELASGSQSSRRRRRSSGCCLHHGSGR